MGVSRGGRGGRGCEEGVEGCFCLHDMIHTYRQWYWITCVCGRVFGYVVNNDFEPGM